MKRSDSLRTIFTSGYSSYCSRFGHTPLNDKVHQAISTCRSASRGGHLHVCDECGSSVPVYNSCGNRHCPQCQTIARYDWVDSRMEELLPVPYFHVVFTVPSELNPIILRNKKFFYKLLFMCVSQTLKELGENSKFLGASLGFIAVLHTWGQNLMDHPHVHCIVPAGGLSRNGTKWLCCKERFLFPFAVMRTLFAGKVLYHLKKAFEADTLHLSGEAKMYCDKKAQKDLLHTLYRKKWVIYAKQPFAGPQKVLAYLGNYTHRVAISNKRIVSVKENSVLFRYKDYSDEGKVKTMHVSKIEFIRRFLLHVLPTGFMRIRHYGFMSNSRKKNAFKMLAEIFRSLRKRIKRTKQQLQPWYVRVAQRTGKDPRLCKVCSKGIMVAKEKLLPSAPEGKISP